MVERIRETLKTMGLEGQKYITPRAIDLVALKSNTTQYEVVKYLIKL